MDWAERPVLFSREGRRIQAASPRMPGPLPKKRQLLSPVAPQPPTLPFPLGLCQGLSP